MPPIIDINKTTRITADKYQWIVQKSKRRRNAQTGEWTANWDNVTYYRTLEHAVQEVFGSEVRALEVSALTDLLVQVNNVLPRLTHALTPEILIEARKNEFGLKVTDGEGGG